MVKKFQQSKKTTVSSKYGESLSNSLSVHWPFKRCFPKPVIQLLSSCTGSVEQIPQLLTELGCTQAISLGIHQPQHRLCNASLIQTPPRTGSPHIRLKSRVEGRLLMHGKNNRDEKRQLH